MIRTQIYLTERQRKGLAAMARSAGKKQSELIREAVDRLIAESREQMLDNALERASGMWKGREDLPDFADIRSSWDRS